MFHIKRRSVQSKIHIVDGVANAKLKKKKNRPDFIITLMRIVLLLHEI